MKKIYEYELQLEGNQASVMLPRGAVPLHIGVHNQQLMLWAEASVVAEPVEIKALAYADDSVMIHDESKFSYFETIHQPPFVWHIYLENQV